MNALQVILAQPVAEAIGRGLIDLVWQGAVVGLVFALGNALLRGSTGRYLFGCVCLLIMLVLPVVSTLNHLQEVPVVSDPTWENVRADVAAIPPMAQMEASPEAGNATTQLPISKRWASLAASIWFVFALLLLVKQIFHWFNGRQLVQVGASRIAEWEEQLRDISEKLGLRRRIRLLQSHRIKTPMTMGWLKPVILMPASMVTGLSPGQIEAILAHELAHIKRCDYLVNLLQVVVENLLFFHPVVWWISQRVREEREYCCDDLAADAIENRLLYARALTEAEQLRIALPPGAVALTGGHFMKRIQRLFVIPHNNPNSLSKALALCVVSLTLLMVLTAANRTVVKAQSLENKFQFADERDEIQAEIQERAHALEEMGLQSVLDTLGDADAINRAAALRALAQFKDEAPVERVVAALNDHEAWVRREAIWTLVCLEEESAAPRLMPMVEDRDLMVASVALRALGAAKSEEAVPLLVEKLSAREVEFRQSSAWALAVMGEKETAADIALQLNDDSVEVRQTAARVLGWLGEKSIAPKLAEALNDIDDEVRENTARSLGYLGEKSVAEALVLAMNDVNPAVREASIQSLGYLGDARALPGVLPALEDDDPQIREHAARAIGYMGASKAGPDLIAMLDDEDVNVREAAARSLGFIAEKSAVQALIKALDDEAIVSEAAARSLGFLGDQNAVPALEKLLNVSDDKLREAAEHSLRLLRMMDPNHRHL